MSTSSREVVYYLKTQLDSSIASGFGDVARHARSAEDEINKASKEIAKSAKDSAREAEREQKEALKLAAAVAKEKERIAKESARVEERELKEALRAAAAVAKEKEKIAKEAAKAEERAAKEIARAAAAAAKEKQRIAKEAAKAEEQESKEALRVAAAVAKEKQRIAKEAAKAEAREVAAAEKAKASAAKQQLALTQKSQRASENYHRSLVNLVSGEEGLLMSGMKIARGGTMLFAKNEEDIQKILKKLMVVQGLYDLMEGSVKLMRGLRTVYANYTADVLASAAAQTASAAAATSAAKAHAQDAIAARADAVANQQLAAASSQSAAAQGASGMAAGARGFGSLAGRGLMAGRGALAAIGGGSVGVGAGVGVAMVAIPALVYKASTHGPQAEAQWQQRRTEIMEESRANMVRYDQFYRSGYSEIGGIERERRSNRDSVAQYRQQARMDSIARGRGALDLSALTEGWTGVGSGRPGQLQFDAVRKALGKDMAVGNAERAERRKQVEQAEAVLRSKQQAYEAAKQQADIFEQNKFLVESNASVAKLKAEEYRERGGGRGFLGNFLGVGSAIRFAGEHMEFVTPLAWADKMGRWGAGRDSRSGITIQQERLDERAKYGEQAMKGAAEQYNQQQEKVNAAYEEQQEALQKVIDAKKEQGRTDQEVSQRAIQNAQNYISTLKGVHKQALENASALEKSSRAFEIGTVVGDPTEHSRLKRAINRAESGKATTRDYHYLASRALTEKRREEFELKALETMTAKQREEAKRESKYMGGGDSETESRRKYAKMVAEEINKQTDYVEDMRKAAGDAAESMANRVAELMEQLVKMMDQKFVDAINKRISEMNTQSKSVAGP
jgi:hypothetical protein